MLPLLCGGRHLPHGSKGWGIPNGEKVWWPGMSESWKKVSIILSVGLSRIPNNGTPLWLVSHTIPISLGILMGIVWETYHKGVPLSGALKIPLILTPPTVGTFLLISLCELLAKSPNMGLEVHVGRVTTQFLWVKLQTWWDKAIHFWSMHCPSWIITCGDHQHIKSSTNSLKLMEETTFNWAFFGKVIQ